MRLRLIVLAGVLMALLLPAVADAATPAPGSFFAHHDHSAKGRNYHVEFALNGTGRRIATAVVFLEECGETLFAEKVPLAADGSFSVSGTLRRGRVRWSITGRFEPADRVEGTYSITGPKCRTGTRFYDIYAAGAAKHDHGSALIIGNQDEYPPAAALAGSASPYVRRARKLRMASLRTMARYDTVAEAQRRNYEFRPADPAALRCPGMHHMRKHNVAFWGKLLDPRGPQALVYWCNSAREFTLAAYMFRARPGRPPTTIDNLLQWHRHGPRGTWMSHLWLVPDTRASLATCAPFAAFERSTAIRYEPYVEDIKLDAPCSDTPRRAP